MQPDEIQKRALINLSETLEELEHRFWNKVNISGKDECFDVHRRTINRIVYRTHWIE